jgi:hypothetical protein
LPKEHIVKTRRILLTLASASLFLAVPVWADGLGDQLIAAAQKGDLAAAKALVEKGADVNAKGLYDQTPIFFAADRGHIDVVRYLIEKGANVNAKDSFYSMTPIARAAMKNRAEVVKLLLDKGATGASQLMFQAIASDSKDGLKMLLDSGKLTPKELTQGLQFANAQKKTEMAEILKAAGAKLPPPANFNIDEATLQSYAGTYMGGRGGTEFEVNMTIDNGKLKGKFGNTTYTLNPTSKTEFRMAEQETMNLEFQTKDGKVTGFLLQPGAQQFTRKEAK